MSLAAVAHDVSKSPLVLIEAGAKVKSIWPPTNSDIKPSTLPYAPYWKAILSLSHIRVCRT